MRASVTVPLPARLTGDAMLKNVLLAVSFNWIAPVLLIVPFRKVVRAVGSHISACDVQHTLCGTSIQRNGVSAGNG